MTITPHRDYSGQIESDENCGVYNDGNDWLVCGDCGRPMYYDGAPDDRYHHAVNAALGCFLIPAEDRPDDLNHPLVRGEKWKMGLCIRIFREVYPDYGTAAGARDKCAAASYEFGELVSSVMAVDWEIVDAMHTDGDNIVLWAHTGIRIGDDVYDWTARQFYPLAAWPTIVSWDEWSTALVPLDDGRTPEDVIAEMSGS